MAAARSKIGTPYVYGGGDIRGATHGGFDCSGLTQYAVHAGTGKTIQRTTTTQYNDAHCHHVVYGQRKAGDLIFWRSGGTISHVGVVSGANTVIHAPHTGDHVREATIWTSGLMPYVQRCY